MSIPLSLTEQLRSFSDGDRDVAETVLREVLPRLHQIAIRELSRERYVAPLSPTELINEVWLRSLGRVPNGLATQRPPLAPFIETTASGFGELAALRHSTQLSRTPAAWPRPSMPPGSHPPVWPGVAVE